MTEIRLPMASGQTFAPLAPCLEDLRVRDLAQGLGNLCRFGGQCRTFYSVAQHSILVGLHLPAAHRFAGLLHDAPEVPLGGDMISPMKQVYPGRQAQERVLASFLAEAWDYDPMPPELDLVDRRALATEVRDLMPRETWHSFGSLPPPWSEQIVPWPPDQARALWLDHFLRWCPDLSRVAM